jgi:hypothetical protein
LRGGYLCDTLEAAEQIQINSSCSRFFKEESIKSEWWFDIHNSSQDLMNEEANLFQYIFAAFIAVSDLENFFNQLSIDRSKLFMFSLPMKWDYSIFGGKTKGEDIIGSLIFMRFPRTSQDKNEGRNKIKEIKKMASSLDGCLFAVTNLDAPFYGKACKHLIKKNINTLKTLKKEIDPKNIMNPGVMYSNLD